MNILLPVIILSLIQGITEFLPISSSAHLILTPTLMGWDDQGIAMDIAVHFGTLMAVMGYFRKDILLLLLGLKRTLNRPSRIYTPMAFYIILATLPVACAGLLLHDFIATSLRNPIIIAIATIFFGVILGLSDRLAIQKKHLTQLNWRSALSIGCAQMLALVPGTSRSGITLTMGLALGFKRDVAARFSFLLAIPTIMMAAMYESLKIWQQPTSSPYTWPMFAFAAVISGLSAYVCIALFMRFINRMGVWPFVWYRIILGCILLFVFV